MDLVEQIANCLLCFFEYYSFYFVIFRKEFRSQLKRNIIGIIICWIAVFVSMAFGLQLLEGNTLPFSRLLFLICIMLYFIFEVSIIEMIGLALGQWLILCVLEMTVYVGLEHLSIEKSIVEIITMLILSGSLWLYYFIIGKRLERELFQLPVKIWYVFDLIMLIITAMMEFFSYVIIEELPEGKVAQFGKGFIISGGTLIVILLFIMIYYINRTKYLQLQKELIESQNEQQKEYFEQLLMKEEETKCFRHDIINDLLEIQNYFEQQKFDELEMYLESTLGTINRIKRKYYDVGNDIINTVLNYYLWDIEEQYEVEISGYMNENIPIKERDLCTISANLIKNAVESVKELPHGKIVFEISQGKQYLSIKVKNTFKGTLKLGKDGLPRTTKKDEKNHGIGLRNVKQVVQKYGGKYNIDLKDENFLIEIFIKI